MTTKVRSRSKKGSSTTPPPPVVSESNSALSSASGSAEPGVAVPDALESTPASLSGASGETPSPSSVDSSLDLASAAGESAGKKRRSRAPAAADSKPSRAPRARKSKTPPPPGVSAAEELALTPTPLPVIVEESSAPPPGADFAATLVDAAPPVAMAPGGWRAPEATPEAAAVAGAVDESPREAAASVPDQDEVSVPPVVSDGEAAAASAELDDQFFSQPPPASVRAAPVIEDVEIRDPKVVQKMSAAVQQRRNRLAKYVKWAVGISATLCLVAFVRQKLDVSPQEASARGAATTEVRRSPAATAPAEPKSAAPAAPSAPSAQPAIEATTASSAPASAAPSETAAVPPVAPSASEAPKPPVEPTASENEATTPPSEDDLKAARKLRLDANNALERGDLGKAIEAGEAAVKLDRTDGHAWYILGSAYMMKNDRVNQVRCFSRCLDAKGGNKAECAQFGGRRTPKP